MSTPRILVVGGGYVGMYTALRLGRKLQRGEARVTVVDPRSYMTYQPFLPEAGAGSIQPRHTVVPLRQTLRRAEVVTGWIDRIDHARKVACVRPLAGEEYELPYDVLVMAVGSVPRTLPIPGLADWASGFKNVEEAIRLRNKGLEGLDIAEGSTDPEVRERALTYVFVGGGYAGVEAMAELEDLLRYATRYLHHVTPEDLRFVLVEAADRILPEVGEEMGRWTVDELRRRGIDVKLGTRLESTVGGKVVLSDGTSLLADTVVWTAGVRAHPMLAATDLPLDERGRLRCRADLSVDGVPDAWGAGDCAAIPDLARPGETCPPSAQHAVRQAKKLADNVVASLRGFPTEDYRHANNGSVASLGLYKGVATVKGVKLKGFPAWFLHRTYHMSKVPTTRRKVAVVTDWTIAFFFKRDVTSLWPTHEPLHDFAAVARGGLPSDRSTPEHRRTT
ncbi:MAG TPA: NAD(P)/FAD-dependent oxidoreductase [Candidatus Nanopelagicales bacterium]|nr:NAD(P)/FAD-dependent oxidoreductase [Candidatus Nanopelagicales bacterium]